MHRYLSKRCHKFIVVTALLLCSVLTYAKKTPRLTEAFKKVAPSVVNIFTVKKIKLKPNNPYQYFAQLYGKLPKEITKRSLGSGVVFTKDGYIVTNYHVIEGMDEIKVQLKDGTVLSAKIVGFDKGTDIAVLKVDPKGHELQPAPLGNSDKLEIAEWVLAIGNPFGLSYTATAGIVSAKGRIIGEKAYDQFIQTDASINPGNSGGPLVNEYGEVVGINTAIIKNAQGIGFAIPINLVKNVFNQIVTTGKVSRGWLGVAAENSKEGPVITEVIKGSPAEKAGLKKGDIILSFNGREVKDIKDLPLWIAETKPGSRVTITVLRKGKKLTKEVTIAELKESPLSERSQKILEILGIRVEKDEKGFFVKEVQPKSPASESMLKAGDRILEINKIKISSAEDIDKALSQVRRGSFLLLRVLRNGKKLYIAIPVP
ncbi:protease Do [Thermosulfidibacter takaii ABI70S6]|uniref:Protease Do n=1 Tax=Thermosulfidibacter takaii (strain DSM 17441 / JCM 13301 / NBRC 103674 / ABI70S6) TaxID=1298851 RepID=A0A0S3QSK2_THET7|nr:protease Do [Thermosulfidibacter takaii ABI70S6]